MPAAGGVANMRCVPSRRAATVLLGAIALGVLAQLLFVRERAGVNVVLAVAAIAVAARVTRPPDAPPLRGDAPALVAALLFAGFCAVRTDAPLVAFDAAAALVLSLAWIAAVRGVDIRRLEPLAIGREAARLAASLLAGAPRLAGEAAPAVRDLARGRSSRVIGYGAGLALATPFIVVFVLLFSSADAVFGRAASDLLGLEWLRAVLRELPARLGVAMLVAWCACGALTHSRGAAGRVAPPRVLPADVALGALVAIDALFAAFVGLQLAYLFGGHDTVAAAGITYSSYARRGFFELVAAAAIVAALLFVFDLVLRARGHAYVAAAATLVVLATVVLVSALRRLGLYQEAYGWTELRFYAIAAVAFLALVLSVLLWAVVRDRMDRTVQPVVVAGLLVAAAVNLLGPSAVVARADIDRFLDPSGLPEDASRGLDVAYLAELGDPAVPAIVEALPKMPEPVRGWMRDLLVHGRVRRGDAGGWQSWNLDRARAEGLLQRLATE